MDLVSAAKDWVPQSVALAFIAVLLTALFAIVRWNFAHMLSRFEHMELTIDVLSKNIDKELNQIKIAHTKFVTFEDLSRTINAIHDKANNTRERVAVLEAKNAK